MTLIVTDLITVNGMWDSDVISHGILGKVDSESGSVLEEKQIDTLHGRERHGTSAYFAINLKILQLVNINLNWLQKICIIHKSGNRIMLILKSKTIGTFFK